VDYVLEQIHHKGLGDIQVKLDDGTRGRSDLNM
jgi:hypothetical protein